VLLARSNNGHRAQRVFKMSVELSETILEINDLHELVAAPFGSAVSCPQKFKVR
jgi:hypothetical protein